MYAHHWSWIFVVLLLNGGVSRCAELRGRVIDDGKPTTANGVAAADIELQIAGGKKLTTITNGRGEFVLVEVPDGEHTLTVSLEGYRPRPYTTKIEYPREKNIVIALMQPKAAAPYYAIVVENMMRRIGKSPLDQSAKAKRAEWEYLNAINLPPESRVLVAQLWKEKDAAITKDIPELADYATAKLDAIAKAQALFAEATLGKAKIPDTKIARELEISDTVIAGIVVYHLRSDLGTKETRKAFSDEFKIQWKGTNVVDLVTASLQQPPKLPSHHAQDR